MKHFNFLSNFRWFTTVILLITLGIGQMWAGYDLSEFTSSSFGGLSSAWSSSGSASSFESTGSARGVQWQKNASTTFTATGFSNVTSVHLWVAKSSSGTGSVKIQENTSAVKTISSFNTTSTEQVHKWGAASPYTGTVKVVVSATKSSIYMKKILVTFLTSITLNANGGATNRTATIDNDSTSCQSFTACTRSGYTCTGYWTAESGGTKILNADGSLAGANITVSTVPYTSSSKWVYAGATLTLYAQWEAAASCSANPSIGDASLNGSFNMTSTTSSIGVSSGTCSTGNAACDWTDYGFVWSDGANTTTPTVGGTNCNKVQVNTTGNVTSWTGSITPSGSTTPTSWTTGHTYYVRAYGKNSKAGAAFVEGTAWSFTPYSVTFKANGGTGSDKVQYVRGGVSTTLTSNSFTKTGYTFNGWNTDADGTSGTGYTNEQSVSLSANLTLYAKWNAKQCTISFDIEGGTGTITNVTATYGQAMPSKESNLPTKTGYNFGGFWDGDGGTGTQYYNADGTSKINWNKDVTATQTLYAKWTIKNYSVTWKVNGEDYTAGTPTDNVNHGSHVTTLPTAPSPASYCGSKFMGWTDADGGVYTHGTSNLYTKASDFPNATAAQTFYAVFADYVAP